MARRADAAGFASFLAIACGLGLLGASAAVWAEVPAPVTIGDLVVGQTQVTTGMELAPLTIVAALVGLLCGFGMLITRGRARRILALPAVLAGLLGAFVAGGVASGLGVSDGEVTVAPWFAVAAALGLVVAGLAGVIGSSDPARRMPARYDVDAVPGDDEWDLASDADRNDPRAS